MPQETCERKEGFMFKDGAPTLQAVMKQVQQVQERIAQVQAELEQKTVMAESGGGMVKVTVNGKHQIVKIEIEKEVIAPDEKEMLEDLIVAAVNKANEEAAAMIRERMKQATGGFLPNIPGLSLPGF
jgi:DNA-binding YbaB/EbfC family protein